MNRKDPQHWSLGFSLLLILGTLNCLYISSHFIQEDINKLKHTQSNNQYWNTVYLIQTFTFIHFIQFFLAAVFIWFHIISCQKMQSYTIWLKKACDKSKNSHVSLKLLNMHRVMKTWGSLYSVKQVNFLHLLSGVIYFQH